jgi:hypothetical protein
MRGNGLYTIHLYNMPNIFPEEQSHEKIPIPFPDCNNLF